MNLNFWMKGNRLIIMILAVKDSDIEKDSDKIPDN